MPKWETYKDCSLVGKSPSFPTQPLPLTPTNHTNLIMSFDDSSSCMDNVLGILHGESSTIPPSHYKAPARTPASRPRGRQTPKPPRTSGFPRQAVTPTVPFNVNGYKLRMSRGYARTYCCPTRGIVLGFSVVGMVGMKGVVGGSVGRRGEWGDRS